MTLRIHQLQVHKRTCQRTCDGCGLQFSRLAGLISHLTHVHPHLLPAKYRSRLDELVCKSCNLTFSRRTSMRRHMEVRHGGAPKYMCPLCSRRFRCQKYIFRHFNLHHPGTFSTTAAKRSAMVVAISNDDSVSATPIGRPLVGLGAL